MKKLKFTTYGNQLFVNTQSLQVSDYYAKREIEGENKKLLIEGVKVNGVKRPIVINTYPGREGVIIDGVEIYKISCELNICELPCYLVEVTEEKEKELHYLFSIKTREYSIDNIIEQLKANQDYFSFFKGFKIPGTSHDDIFNDAAKMLLNGDKNFNRIKGFPLRIIDKYKSYPEKLKVLMGAKSQNEAIVKLIVEVVEGRISL
jgi:hypothetical protein